MALIKAARPKRERGRDAIASERTVVFVTFESEFAPLGGLSAVMKFLPRQMAVLERGDCFTITPFFRNIARCNVERFKAITSTSKTFTVRFGSAYYDVEIFKHTDAEGFITYLLDSDVFFNASCDCENPPSVNAPCNPYLNPDRPEQLLQDALFFCAAVSKALVVLGYTKHLILGLQDWQAATAALTVKKEPAVASAACVLTLHNPYDRPVSDEAIAQIFWRELPGPTILTKMFPFLDGPLCTVSEHFATELVQDPLHTRVYAPHLQDAFQERGIVGIDNGLFAALDFPQPAIDAARSGQVQPILEEKRQRRAALVEVLEAYQPQEAWGDLSDLDTFEGPIFLMFGRDDPRQKGYDIVASAIAQIPEGQAKYIFTPIPGDEGLAGLQFLKDLAERRAGDVKVFPFRMAQGYRELQRGSSYLIMPSLYEPFGSATEGYAVGTPVVARATGGLVQQIVPYPASSLGISVRRMTDAFHTRGEAPTGFLFREPAMPELDVIADWKRMIACDYVLPNITRVQDRRGIRLFDAMVQEAAWAIADAVALYVDHPRQYAQMIASGFAMLKRFSWERAVREYQRIYDLVSA
jgi:glycogen synthase